MIRTFAVKALGRWGTAASIAKLEPLLNDPDGEIQRSAKIAIDAIRRREKQGS